MKVLILTEESRAAAARARTPDATVLTDTQSLSDVQGEFDAAVIDGVLERERWDRWLLQRVHGLLRMDAPIMVVVPPLVSFASAFDVRFFAYLCRRLVGLPARTHRRYYMPSLMRKMESVGFTAVEADLASRGVLKARKERSLAAIAERKKPDVQLHGRWFSEQYAVMHSARESWLARFPEYASQTACALDPSAWRDARVLVLAPHPDDDLVGCGGTLCRLAAVGAELTVLQATDGARLSSLQDLPEARRRVVRLEEAERVAGALGARLVLWREEDQGLQCSEELVRRLGLLLEELRPTHVFTPFIGDVHADHRTLSHILGGALAMAAVAPQVLQYEVWSLVPANAYCDVTESAGALEDLLLLYEHAMQVDDFVHVCESRNLARSLELTGKPGYAEAFLSTTSAEYQRLVTKTCGAPPVPWSPKISVVMPVFNAEKYVAEAIESILGQTYGNFEFIIVDDCSTDRSRKIIRQFTDPRIRLHVNEENRGVAFTLNRGLGLATGELIARMDADDISFPGRFARQVRQFALEPELVLCCTNGRAMSEDGTPSGPPWYCGDEDIAWSLLFYCPIPHASVMLRASRIAGLAYPHTRAQDVGLWREMLGRGSFYRAREVMIKYRVHQNNVSRQTLAESQGAALGSARRLFTKLVGETRASHLLLVTNHYAESGVQLPRCGLAELHQAGIALAHAYCRSFAPHQDRSELVKDFELRMFWYCFRRNGRSGDRSAAHRVAAGAGEWIRSLGALSLCAAAIRFLAQRLQKMAASVVYRERRARRHSRRREAGPIAASQLRTEE